ncbi:MAG TPA: RibD family protein [Verrucomicrobiae bacterium]|jgi:riboflavin-specific deaminase-like protein|nr:RibD family protein [Verrucomicrobiae bacterium]
MKNKLPFVFSNFAMTADGKIAFANGRFTPFSSQRDREHMMELRATADAVMCGARTIETTGTIMGNGGEKFRKLRIKRGLAEYPLRVIVSGSGSINSAAKIFQKRFSPIVVLTTGRISKANLKKLRAVADEVKICGKTEINFPAALRWLREKWKIRRLLCEGGGELHGALIRAGLVDELHLTLCPKIFGGRTAPTVADGKGFLHLSDAARFKLKSTNRIGDEIFAIYARRKKP